MSVHKCVAVSTLAIADLWPVLTSDLFVHVAATSVETEGVVSSTANLACEGQQGKDHILLDMCADGERQEVTYGIVGRLKWHKSVLLEQTFFFLPAFGNLRI